MTSISSRSASAMQHNAGIEGDDATSESDAARRFDYAKLLRGRSHPHRPVARDAQSQAGAASSLQAGDGDERNGNGANSHVADTGIDQDSVTTLTGGSAGHPGQRDPRGRLGWDAASDDADTGTVGSHGTDGIQGGLQATGAAGAGHITLAERVTHAAEPLVSSVLLRQQHMLDLVNTLSREIAGFSSDAAIVNSGNWEVQVPLDGRLVPHTTLYMTLSRYHMVLRFEVSDPDAKQLLLDHSAMLERELDAMLRAWGESRDIQLTIW